MSHIRPVENYQNQEDNEATCYECVLDSCGGCAGCLRAWCPCACCWCPYPYKEVRQGFIGLKERFGQFKEELQPGLHSINPCTEIIHTVNLRTM